MTSSQPDARALIDRDLVESISAAHAWDATAEDAARLARVRERLFATIALEPRRPLVLTTHARDGAWSPFLPGVQIRVLHREHTYCAYLLKLEANAELPAHSHEIDEECLVLEGDLMIDDELRLTAGDFHLARSGHFHKTIRSERGATIMLRGAAPF